MKKNLAAAILTAAVIVTVGVTFIGCSSGSVPTGVSSKGIIRDLQTGDEIGDMDKVTGEVVFWRILPDGEYRAQVEDHGGAVLGYLEIKVENGSARFKYKE